MDKSDENNTLMDFLPDIASRLRFHTMYQSYGKLFSIWHQHVLNQCCFNSSTVIFRKKLDSTTCLVPLNNNTIITAAATTTITTIATLIKKNKVKRDQTDGNKIKLCSFHCDVAPDEDESLTSSRGWQRLQHTLGHIPSLISLQCVGDLNRVKLMDLFISWHADALCVYATANKRNCNT